MSALAVVAAIHVVKLLHLMQKTALHWSRPLVAATALAAHLAKAWHLAIARAMPPALSRQQTSSLQMQPSHCQPSKALANARSAMHNLAAAMARAITARASVLRVTIHAALPPQKASPHVLHARHVPHAMRMAMNR